MLKESIILNAIRPQRYKNYAYLNNLCAVNSVGGFVCGVLTTLASAAVIKYAVNVVKEMDEELERISEEYEGMEGDGENDHGDY